MSQETMQWLNTQTLIGDTDKRGTAWHYRKEDQGERSNHYPNAIPVEDVRTRLFNWEAIELPISVSVPGTMDDCTSLDAEGNPIKSIELPGRKAIARGDNFHVMGLFKEGYLSHQPGKWLIDNVASLLGEDLHVSSAGLLKQGAVAWVEISMPDNLQQSGVEFRPNLLACTSFDGSLATTYKRTVTLTVCDNTMNAALGEKGQQVKIRHSRYSDLKITDARDALAIISETADQFAGEIARLAATPISSYQWEKVLNALVPMPESKSQKRATTMATEKREVMERLYKFDTRVAPWKGTAFGVLQAFNTYEHHEKGTRSNDKAERNMLNAINGETDKTDNRVLEVLASV